MRLLLHLKPFPLTLLTSPQRCIDWNRDILKKELGLEEKDIIDIPALFKIDKAGKAMAYFPNMVRISALCQCLLLTANLAGGGESPANQPLPDPSLALSSCLAQVNMIVLSRDLGVPKPFGPIIGEECCLEQHVSSLLEPLGLTCSYIDDISSYHKQLGEVHCGTNVQRKPFAYSWWNVSP